MDYGLFAKEGAGDEMWFFFYTTWWTGWMDCFEVPCLMV